MIVSNGRLHERVLGALVLVVGGMTLPRIVAPNAELHSMLWNAHRFLAFCFFALILLHLAAALLHALVRRDGVFEAMVPHRAE